MITDCETHQAIHEAQLRSAQLLVQILGRDDGATTPGGQRLVAEYAAAVRAEFPPVDCGGDQ